MVLKAGPERIMAMHYDIRARRRSFVVLSRFIYLSDDFRLGDETSSRFGQQPTRRPDGFRARPKRQQKSRRDEMALLLIGRLRLLLDVGVSPDSTRA